MAEISLRELWRESLAPFRNGNLKLYLLGTFATSIRALKILLLTFWKIFLIATGIIFGVAYLLSRLNIRMFTIMGSLFLIISIITMGILWYLIILATRPSLEPKTRAYFKAYFRGWWSILLLMLLIPGSNLAGIIALPFITINLLFFLDTDLSLDAFAVSLVRGVKTLVYFLPGFMTIFFSSMICLLSSVTIVLGIGWLFSFLMKLCISNATVITVITALCATTLFVVIAASFMTLLAAAITTYYVKIKHEHHEFLLSK
jgi:hypothetical protein